MNLERKQVVIGAIVLGLVIGGGVLALQMTNSNTSGETSGEFPQTLAESQAAEQAGFTISSWVQYERAMSDRTISRTVEQTQTPSAFVRHGNSGSAYLADGEDTSYAKIPGPDGPYYQHGPVENFEPMQEASHTGFDTAIAALEITLQETETTDDGNTVANYTIQGISSEATSEEVNQFKAKHLTEGGDVTSVSGSVTLAESGLVENFTYTATIGGEDYQYQYEVVESGESDVTLDAGWVSTAREEGLAMEMNRVTDHALAIDVTNGQVSNFTIRGAIRAGDSTTEPQYFRPVTFQGTLNEGDTFYATLQDGSLVVSADEPSTGTPPSQPFTALIGFEERMVYSFTLQSEG